MNLIAKARQLRTALGSPSAVLTKCRNAGRTLATTFNRTERTRRLEHLKTSGCIDEIPNEWQILQGSYQMLRQYIIPSNTDFYRHYKESPYWLQFLRVLDEPSAMMDPTGLAVSRDMIISHLLHVVHCSAGYDVDLLNMFPGGLDELERQLTLYLNDAHPRQNAIATLLERPDYPSLLLAALKLYRQNPTTHWKVSTFATPKGCEERFEPGIERFGSPSRLLQYSLTLPPTPWKSLKSRWVPA